MNSEPLVIERTYAFPVSKVWNAITSKDCLKEMGFVVDDFRPQIGFEFHFDGQKGDFVFHHTCVVTEVAPEQKLAYSWRYDGYQGISYVTFELFAEGDATRLRLTHTGIEEIEVNGPDFARANFNMGWTYIIGTAVPGFLERN